MTAILEVFSSAFGAVQQALFEAVVQPTLFSLGFANFLDDGFDATGWLLVGLMQLAVLVTLIGPLQRWRPVEAVTDRATVRVDMLYTAIHRLGLFRVVLFFTVAPRSTRCLAHCALRGGRHFIWTRSGPV